MKKTCFNLSVTGLCAVGLLIGFSSVIQLQAQSYDVTFTGNSSAANGEIDVVGGIATSGYLDVTSGPNQGTYNLVSLTSPLITGGTSTVPSARITDGTDLIFDDMVNPGSNPFLDGNGLAFANDNTIGFNLWGNGPNSYSLLDVSGAPVTHVYTQDNGTATIAVVPEPASIALTMLGLAALAGCQRWKKTV